VLTTASKPFYFIDKGVQRGIVVDYFRVFEDELNKKLAAENKLKDNKLKVRVVFIPVRRDQLLPGIAAGRGDIAAANLTITPERQKLVDFSRAGRATRSWCRGRRHRRSPTAEERSAAAVRTLHSDVAPRSGRLNRELAKPRPSSAPRDLEACGNSRFTGQPVTLSYIARPQTPVTTAAITARPARSPRVHYLKSRS
jgi:hypothetical protein